jgi:hypothetical protein
MSDVKFTPIAYQASDPLIKLALQIADECARSDIETECNARDIDGHRWYDTQDIDADTAHLGWVARAANYLRMRGQLETHPTSTHLVRLVNNEEPS